MKKAPRLPLHTICPSRALDSQTRPWVTTRRVPLSKSSASISNTWWCCRASSFVIFIKPQLVVLDAVRVLVANGPEGGNLADVKRRDTIVAGVDQVAVDAFGATLLGLGPQDIGYVVESHARGLGNMNYAALSPARVEV